jgi:Uma2 family endonuclease
MSSVLPTTVTLADLARADGKAELIAGRIVPLTPTGFHPGRIGGRIFRSLDDHARRTGHGIALPDNVGFRRSRTGIRPRVICTRHLVLHGPAPGGRDGLH